jgi:hypothetical protein
MPAFGFALLFATGLSLLPGCEEATMPETATTQQTPKRPELPRIKWLDAHSTITPEQWLASREAKVDLDENDPAVVALRVKLNEAAQRFGDATRMIANRAVQLEEMLAEEGITEHAPELIETLSSTATETRQREGFGSLTQHYFNLRKTGVDREVALEQLKKTSVYWSGDAMQRG